MPSNGALSLGFLDLLKFIPRWRPAAFAPSRPNLAHATGLRTAVATASTALLGYGALVVWLTWPLGAQLATQLPNTAGSCGFDTLYAGWVLAFESHTLATAPSHLLDANIYHPTPHALFYGPAAFGALPYFAPVFLATGNPTLALNLELLLCVTLTAWTLHLVVRHWTGSELAGVVAACCFLTTRWVLWKWLPTAPNYAVLQYFPVIVLLAARPSAGVSRLLLLLGLVVLQCLTDLAYVAPAVLAPLGLLALSRLVRRGSRRAGLGLLLVLAAALVVLAPVLAPYWSVSAAMPDPERQTFWPRILDRYPLVLPWGLFEADVATAVPTVVWLLVAAGVLSLVLRPAGVRARSRGAWLNGALWLTVGVVISLNPIATWNGEPVRIPQTYLAAWLPLYRSLRAPARLGVAGLMGAALLAGLAFSECAARIPSPQRLRWAAPLGRATLAFVLVGAMYLQYAEGLWQPATVRWTTLPARYPLAAPPEPDSPVLRALRRPGGPLLELPTGFQATGFQGPLPPSPAPDTTMVQFAFPPANAKAMYRSTYHWRPLLNGYSSYWPADFIGRMMLASRLPDEAALATLRRDTGVSEILVHTAYLDPSRRTAWLSAAASGTGGLRLVVRDGSDLLFSVVEAGGRNPDMPANGDGSSQSPKLNAP
jgi:hypothetical protein